MKSTTSLILLIAEIVVAALLVSYILSAFFPATQWVPIGLSVASIAIAVLSAFKSELFDFSPELIGGDFALIHSSVPNATHSGVLFPIYFANRGYGEGAILGIAVEVTNHLRNEKYLLTPVAELDMHKLMQNTGRMHATNILGPFISFPLGSKQVVSKSVAFNWVNNNPKYAQPQLDAAEYTFDIFIRTDRRPRPFVGLTIKHTFTQDVINSFQAGNAIYNMHGNPFE